MIYKREYFVIITKYLFIYAHESGDISTWTFILTVTCLVLKGHFMANKHLCLYV